MSYIHIIDEDGCPIQHYIVFEGHDVDDWYQDRDLLEAMEGCFEWNFPDHIEEYDLDAESAFISDALRASYTSPHNLYMHKVPDSTGEFGWIPKFSFEPKRGAMPVSRVMERDDVIRRRLERQHRGALRRWVQATLGDVKIRSLHTYAGNAYASVTLSIDGGDIPVSFRNEKDEISCWTARDIHINAVREYLDSIEDSWSYWKRRIDHE